MHAIFNFMQELFTRENVTFAIAVFGAVGTAKSIFQSRKKHIPIQKESRIYSVGIYAK